LAEAPLDKLMARFELLDEDGRPFPADRLPGRRALAGERGAEEVLRFRILATGEERWAIVKAMPIFGKQGTVRMTVNIFRDITESKRAQESLRRLTEAERKRMARDLHDGVLQDLSYTAAAIGMIMLQVEDTKLKEQLQAAVDAVRRGAHGLRRVVADLRRANPEVGVLILSASLDAASLKSDADEIMDKLAPLDEVLGTVRRLGNA
jgi:signal transduction histidine kinase